MNCRHCTQPTQTSREQDWVRRSRSTERVIEDQHNAPITQSGRWAKKWGRRINFSNIANNKHQQAGNDIGDEGARALSEAVKKNTTLPSLYMWGEQKVRKTDKFQTLPPTNANKQWTRLAMKEQEHWAKQWRTTHRWLHCTCGSETLSKAQAHPVTTSRNHWYPLFFPSQVIQRCPLS